jgi:hypothetical protein
MLAVPFAPPLRETLGVRNDCAEIAVETHMGAVIGGILPLAFGVALSPLPIMAVIVMLLVAQRKGNAIAFTIGWALGAFVECALVVFLAGGAVVATSATSSENRSRLIGVIELLIGLVTLALAMYQWHTRPAPDEEPKLPKWMKALDRLTPSMSLAFGAVYVAGNVKNVPLIVSAGARIGIANIHATEQIIALVIFALLCTLGPGLPVMVYLVGGNKAKTTLGTWKTWLEQHNSAVMTVLLLFFGVKFIGDALAGLL